MKINYNGQELETITEGYWPEGVTLVCEKNKAFEIFVDVVCMRNSHVMLKNGYSYGAKLAFSYWAVLPPKPPTRRLTNREVGELCKKGWDIQDGSSRVFYRAAMVSTVDTENDPCDKEVRKLRAPGSDEWLEPTSDLLEV